MLADLTAHFGVENLCSATGETPQPRFDHILQHPADGFLSEPAEPVYFNRRPSLEMKVRIRIVQELDNVTIPIVLRLVMQPTDDVHLCASGRDRLLASRQDLLVVHPVAFGVTQVGTKGAERAAVDTDVCGIEVGIDVVVGEISVLPLTNHVCQFAQLRQRHIGAFK
jgi:hypothetical protein